MHDRKVAIIKNKKIYMSSDYVRKIINTYKGRNLLNSNQGINDILLKIEGSQNIDVSKEQPLILFNKSKKRDINMENQIKKELAENQGFLNNDALKKNLLRFYSYDLSKDNTTKTKTKNLFRYPLSYNKKRKARNKQNTNSELFHSIQSMDGHKRNKQEEYSNSIRERLKSSTSKKNKNNNLYVGTQAPTLKRKNTMEQLTNNILINKKFLEKSLSKKEKNMNSIRQRKKEYLDLNAITYENIDVEENKSDEKEKKRKVKIFKNGKYIKNIFKNKKENKSENNKENVVEKKKKKLKDIKCSVDAFEYINKIQKEIKNLKIVSNK